MIGLDLFTLCVSNAYLIRHLVSTVVVDGLGQFQVGVRDVALFTGDTVDPNDPNSYTTCDDITGNPIRMQSVSIEQVIEVVCEPEITGRWVIIQTLQPSPSDYTLCLAEVVIEMYGEYVSMFILVRQVGLTLHITNCSCLFLPNNCSR